MKQRYENSRLIHASFGSREMFSQWFTSAFGLYTFFYYESVIGLPSGLALAAFLVFSTWNVINAPLAGYLMEKLKMPWQRRRQMHRFPWILIGGIPWIFSYLLIFLVPLVLARAARHVEDLRVVHRGAPLVRHLLHALRHQLGIALPGQVPHPRGAARCPGLGHAPGDPRPRPCLRDHRDDREPEPSRELPPGGAGLVCRRVPAVRAHPPGRVREQAHARRVCAQPGPRGRSQPALLHRRPQGPGKPHRAGEVPLLLRLPGRRGAGQRFGALRHHLHPG